MNLTITHHDGTTERYDSEDCEIALSLSEYELSLFDDRPPGPGIVTFSNPIKQASLAVRDVWEESPEDNPLDKLLRERGK
jgi:hypothetical protein